MCIIIGIEDPENVGTQEFQDQTTTTLPDDTVPTNNHYIHDRQYEATTPPHHSISPSLTDEISPAPAASNEQHIRDHQNQQTTVPTSNNFLCDPQYEATTSSHHSTSPPQQHTNEISPEMSASSMVIHDIVCIFICARGDDGIECSSLFSHIHSSNHRIIRIIKILNFRQESRKSSSILWE